MLIEINRFLILQKIIIYFYRYYIVYILNDSDNPRIPRFVEYLYLFTVFVLLNYEIENYLTYLVPGILWKINTYMQSNTTLTNLTNYLLQYIHLTKYIYIHLSFLFF